MFSICRLSPPSEYVVGTGSPSMLFRLHNIIFMTGIYDWRRAAWRMTSPATFFGVNFRSNEDKTGLINMVMQVRAPPSPLRSIINSPIPLSKPCEVSGHLCVHRRAMCTSPRTWAKIFPTSCWHAREITLAIQCSLVGEKGGKTPTNEHIHAGTSLPLPRVSLFNVSHSDS